MELVILLGTLLMLMAIGVPVAIALGASSLLTLFVLDIPLVVGFQRMAASMNIFALMAIPFFVFAGDLMHRAGIAERLIRLAEATLGRSRGGLGQVGVGSSMMFGAVSGSAIASASAIGSALGPIMLEKNYDRDYIVNVTATSAVTGLLIPPSHNMIIYAAAAGVSISLADLFLAGLFPGILTGVLLMMASYCVARSRNYPGGGFSRVVGASYKCARGGARINRSINYCCRCRLGRVYAHGIGWGGRGVHADRCVTYIPVIVLAAVFIGGYFIGKNHRNGDVYYWCGGFFWLVTSAARGASPSCESSSRDN